MMEEVNLPVWSSVELSCKTKLFYLERNELPIISILILIKGGSSRDFIGKEGLARLVSKTIISGTKRMDSKTIAFETERIGALLDVYTSRDFTIFKIESLSKNFEKAMEILSEIVLNPSFTKVEIEKEKEKALSIIKEERSDPSLIATKKSFELIFSETPYAHSPIGYPFAIKKITRDDIINFYKNFYVPENSFLVLVGDFDDKIIKIVDKFLTNWKRTSPKLLEPVIKVNAKPEFLILNDPDSSQTQIRIGKFLSLKKTDEDYIPVLIGNLLLGKLFTSRLVSKVRGELGLSYSIDSSVQLLKHGGLFLISTFTKNETVVEMLRILKKEVEYFVNYGIEEEELERAKKFIKGRFPSSIQTNSDLAGKISEIEFYGLPKDHIKNLLRKIDELSREKVNESVRKHLRLENYSILALGKAEEIEKPLSFFGKFNVKELKDV